LNTSDENPFAPPSYPPPTGPAFADGGTLPPAEMPPPPSNLAVQRGAFAPPADESAPPGLAKPIHKSATVALVLAILTPVLTPLVGIAGWVMGRRVLRDVVVTGEGGAGRARVAVWLGAGLAVLWVMVVAFILAAMAGARAA
jgi:hypothetical protein